jgi:hypothetical protein
MNPGEPFAAVGVSYDDAVESGRCAMPVLYAIAGAE